MSRLFFSFHGSHGHEKHGNIRKNETFFKKIIKKKANVHYSLFQVEDNHLVSEVILNKQILDLYLYSLPFIPSHLADNISIIIFNEFLHPCVFCVSHLFLTVSHLLTWKATRLHWVLFVFHFPSSFSLQVSWMHFLLKTF